MQVHTFIADSAADAVAQIRAQLGPNAVVLNVRRLPVEGLSRLWQKPRIEVLAHLPELPATPDGSFAELRQEIEDLRKSVRIRESPMENLVAQGDTTGLLQGAQGSQGMAAMNPSSAIAPGVGGGGICSFLENGGLSSLHAHRIVEEMRSSEASPPDSLSQELERAQAVLVRLWDRERRPARVNSRMHVFVGAPGAGKTTCLCKWLAQTVLLQGRPAKVWRLDGRTANTAESLSVYCEILGVSVERFPPIAGSDHTDRDILFIDLPGVNWTDAGAMSDLAGQLKALPDPQVHLVLNAAYDLPLLLAQTRAFASLPVTDLIFSHLDEEPRWGKLWNFVLGTNYSIRFLSAGQNIPGDFVEATPEPILARQFPRK